MEQASSVRVERERGSALVESALVLTIFVVLVVAVLDFAQFLFIHQSLVEASRRAARYGVANVYSEEQIRNIVLYDSVDAAAGSQPRFGLDASMVEVSRFDSGSTSDRVKVTISNYRFNVYTPLIAGTLRGLPITTVLPYEGN